MWIDTAGDYETRRGGYNTDGTLSGINNVVLDAVYGQFDKNIGFRALVMKVSSYRLQLDYFF
jgi:hypothetical protein